MSAFQSIELQLITSSLILISVLAYYIHHKFLYWKRKKIPYIKPSFPFGNLENLLTTKLSLAFHFKKFYDELKRQDVKHGGGVFAFLSPIYVAVEPNTIKSILVKHFQHFNERGLYYNEKDQPVSANLAFVDGDKWRNLRNKFTPVFTATKIKSMFHTMISTTKALEKNILEHAQQKKALNIKECSGRFVINIIGSVAFGIDCISFSETISPIHKHVLEMLKHITNFVRHGFCNTYPNLAKRLKFTSFPNSTVHFFESVIESTLKSRTEDNIVRNDFLDILINLHKQGNITLTDIKSNSIMFFAAGFETSTATMTFTLYELAYNTDIQVKARTEIEEVLSRFNGEITYESVAEMTYVEMIIEETLRKYPPSGILFRKCNEAFTIPGTEQVLEKGENVIIPVLGLHRDPEYFPNPDIYDPERFRDESIKNQYYYLPFGEGPRNCIGARFGTLLVKIAVISMVKNFHFSLNPATKVPLEIGTNVLTTSAHDILLDVETIEKRK